MKRIDNNYPRDSNLDAQPGRQPAPRTPQAEFRDVMLGLREFGKDPLPMPTGMPAAEDPPRIGREMPSDPEPDRIDIAPPGDDVLDLGDLEMDGVLR